MPPTLTPTNMKREEMVPETDNPVHNPLYWCLPPVRDEPSEGGVDRFAMYLVSQGRSVGVWHNWTVVEAMVSGYPSGAQRGHHTMQGCIAEWQQHCLLGVHPHPADPAHVAHPLVAMRVNLGQDFRMPNIEGLSLREGGSDVAESETSPSSPSSLTATTWEEVSAVARYFALWGGGIVYTDRGQAKVAFLEAEASGKKPRILSTVNYDEAQAFSESVYWL
ncbi:hypothetical protein B0H14DRAFT_3430053 [Mycena olivaceomarginata]|nr:hypothetical protein B0H14DRAFT_3430053 [Mycena olivaceomarginata]